WHTWGWWSTWYGGARSWRTLLCHMRYLKCWRKGLVERMICGSLGMLNAIVRVLHKSLTFHISLSQEGAKLRYQNGNILPFVQCDRDRYCKTSLSL
ncbi:hypothetical protein, partial [Microcoleus anatoxicus]|uniref:hypothetical protein n=1 Tax=Microcoleus anatoxicus TaxID=2705319 RepID=UPI0030C943A1